MARATDKGPRELAAARTEETGVSQARGSLVGTEAGSLRTLAGAFVELAIQVLSDEKDVNQSEEAKAA